MATKRKVIKKVVEPIEPVNELIVDNVIPVAEPIINDDVELTDSNTINGLGDVVKGITTFLGIKQCEPCKERQEKMNKAFPFNRAKRPFTIEEVEFLNIQKNLKKIKSDDVDTIYKLYNDVFKPQSYVNRSNCGSCLRRLMDRLIVFLPE